MNKILTLSILGILLVSGLFLISQNNDILFHAKDSILKSSDLFNKDFLLGVTKPARTILGGLI